MPKTHIEVNPCEIHGNFHRKPNAMHRPVIYQSVKLLHRTAAYPAVPHDLSQNDEADRGLLHMAQYYVDGKPVADKLGSIRFEKPRQKYKSEHDDTLRTFYMAERKLKPYFKDGKIPITAWRRERERLEQEYKDIQTELSPLYADVKKLWAIHYNIYEVQHEQERQQTQLHSRKNEIEL